MSQSKVKTEVASYQCISCKQWHDKYSVIQFKKLNLCTNCFEAHPFSRENNILATEDSIIAYYKAKGVSGELYPCKPDIFEKTYEKVEEKI